VRHAVILAGGSGTRLWPASRRRQPKQFLPLAPGGETLLGGTVRRARAVTDKVVVVTAADQADATLAAAPGVALLAEPAPRNTALAIGLAAVHLAHADPDAVLGVLPADHHVGDEARLAAAQELAFGAAERHDVICTIGIRPTRPETGFGYVELGTDEVEPGVTAVRAFLEKPDAATATRFVADGRHLWNAGMFFARAARIIDDIRNLLPQTAAVLDGVAGALAAEGPVAAADAAVRLYPGAPSVSFDTGIMERTTGRVVVPADVGWNDVGSWAALRDVRGTDPDGNTIIGDAVALDAGNNVIATDPGTMVAVVGVDDLIVVRSGDAVIVLPRSRAQDVRRVVEELARRGKDGYL
jgi:mannose-1-phosphate guanylyltransferase